ncbi:MAG: HAMP domain-containing histidine kinase [Planctomycetes bacterium]|nr:HAMP domain-containing histidine kinase [Planctomycetota bacterium]
MMRSASVRLVAAFLALFAATSALLLWGAATQARRMAEERALEQAKTVGGLMLKSGFVGPEMLGRVKAVVDAEVVEVLAGRVRGSTLAREESEAVSKAARAAAPFAESGRFRVVAVTEGDTTLVFAFEAEKLEAAKSEAVRPLWWLAGGAVLGVTVLGLWLGASLLRPVGALVAGARRIEKGDLSQDVPFPGADEFGALATAFNSMQAALRKQREDERWAEAGRVAAGVAHDLRNPLAGVLMMAQMLERDEKDPRRREVLQRIVTEVKRLEVSIGELMALASPEPPKKERVDLAAVAKEALELFQSRAEHRGVALESTFAPARFTGDAGRARRIVDNLVANALEATPAGGRVTVRVQAPAELRVADTGGGIPEAMREKLFEAFNSDKAGGTGLGLATVKKLAEEMGGKVEFETGPAGTTFLVRFQAAE